jgi:hypothetical protein
MVRNVFMVAMKRDPEAGRNPRRGENENAEIPEFRLALRCRCQV